MITRARNVSKTIIVSLSLCAFATAPLTTHADVIQVYLQGGQSNSDGRGSPSGLPTSPTNLQLPQADVEFFFHTQGSIHALDSTLTTLRPGMSETSGFGPEITFGRDMADYISGTPGTSIAIIKYANGGTNLHTQWKAGGDAMTTNDGSEYVIFQNTVTAGLAAIATAHPSDTVIIAGMIWHQGESDIGSAAAYEVNLTNFIDDIRATYGANLPFVIGEILNNGTSYQTIRAAQAAVAAADPFAGFVDVDSFDTQDALHFSHAGQMSLGSGFALEMQALLATPFTALTSIADTYIRESTGTTNYGSDTVMVANNSSTRLSFIRFDISAFETITAAKLELETTIASSGQDYEVLGLLEDDDDWVENTLTWDNSTNLSGSTIDTTDIYGGTSLAIFTDNGTTAVFTVFDVNSGNVVNFLNADTDGIVTFVISEPGAIDGGGTGWATKEHATALAPTLSVSGSAADTTAPNPDPMTFSDAPSAVDDSSITMTATTATDSSGVEYFFENTAGGGNDSGWQDSAVYVDTGLTANTEYSYRVRARDKSTAQNVTNDSSAATATTAITGESSILTTIADSYIRSSQADTNFGADDLMVANNRTSFTRYSFIRFDISGLGTISAAKLELETTITSSGQVYDVLGLLEGDDDWAEGALTWNNSTNRSGNAIDLADTYGGASIASFTDNGNLAVFNVFDVTSGDVIDFLNADVDGIVTFVISESGSADNAGTGWATKEHATALAPTLTVTGSVADIIAPNPNPMTFSTAPSTVDDSSITMTATTATDTSGVEYFFENTAGGGNDSGWQDSAVYVDTGLIANTEYSYRVRARDKSTAQNMTFDSPSASATTASATTSLISVQDTYIRDSDATTNYGADGSMQANDNSSSVRIAVFSFDITSVPAGTVHSIKLELEDVVGNANQDYEIWGLLDTHEAFDESTLTWNTASFLSDVDVDTTKAYGGAALGTFSNTSNSINIVFNETSGTFLDFLGASSNNIITFVIVDPSNAGAGTGWATKEDGVALAPTLTIVTTAIGYVDWASDYPGLDLSNPTADYDLDGLSNSIEAWFGTNPGLSNPGLSITSTDGIVSVLSHPQNTSPPSDLLASYQWSPNLVDWYSSGDGPDGGTTATIVPNTVDSTTTVTLTASQAISKLFIRVVVAQAP